MITTCIRIGGMSCISCQNRIEKKLQETAGIASARVSFAHGTADISYDETQINMDGICALINDLGYAAQSNAVKSQAREKPNLDTALQTVGYLLIIFSLYTIFRHLLNGGFAANFPLARAGMSYGMIFIIGLITSVHCLAMCGGINLSQCMSKDQGGEGAGAPVSPSLRTCGSSLPPLRGSAPVTPPSPTESNPHPLYPSILYNGGRVIGYTAVGFAVGALGSVLSLSVGMQAAVQLAAGVFMIIMAINMLGIFPGLRRFAIHLPAVFARKIDDQKIKQKSPFIIGLLNSLMPCGPLQAMQLYALSSGSALAGGIAMFLFSAGTVPLMFGFGALSSVLSKASFGRALAGRIMKAGAILVAVLGLVMFSQGWALGDFSGRLGIGFGLPSLQALAASDARAGGEGVFAPRIENGVQIVNSTLSAGRYPAITVQSGIPVKWNINAPPGSINGCNNRMIIRQYGIEHAFKPGDNIIEFMPDKTGRFAYSCWMGMIRSSITVVEAGALASDIAAANDITPKPAGVAIPADSLALADIDSNGIQTVRINLTDDGFEPAVAVVQKNLRTRWIIVNNSLDEGNSVLVFPAYYTQLSMQNGDNEIALLPTNDFEFSTIDNIFYGYVKVVDAIKNIDVDAIKKEVAAHETLIYPDAYFEAAAGGGAGCCGSGGGA